MEVVVLIKEIPDLDVWVEIAPKTLVADPNDVAYVPNPIDWAALGLALDLVRQWQAGCVTVMLLGPKGAERTLRRCWEYGARRAIHMVHDSASELESHQIAQILAAAIRRFTPGFDLVFCGHDHSGYGLASGQIGSQVGALLDLPQASQVKGISLSIDRDHLIMESLMERGDRITVKARPPLILTVHPDAGQMGPPPLSAALDALDAPVERVDPMDLQLNPSEMEPRTQWLSVSTPRPRPKKVFTPDSALSAAERIRQIMGGGLGKKRSDFLEGDAQDLARHIVDFLVTRRIMVPRQERRAASTSAHGFEVEHEN